MSWIKLIKFSERFTALICALFCLIKCCCCVWLKTPDGVSDIDLILDILLSLPWLRTIQKTEEIIISSQKM